MPFQIPGLGHSRRHICRAHRDLCEGRGVGRQLQLCHFSAHHRRCFRTGPSDLVDGRGAVTIHNLPEDGDISGAVRSCDWRVMVVLFSCASARQGLAGRTHRQVERCARRNYRRGFSWRKVINDRMERRRFDRARRGSCGLVLICRERGLGTEQCLMSSVGTSCRPIFMATLTRRALAMS